MPHDRCVTDLTGNSKRLIHRLAEVLGTGGEYQAMTLHLARRVSIDVRSLINEIWQEAASLLFPGVTSYR